MSLNAHARHSVAGVPAFFRSHVSVCAGVCIQTHTLQFTYTHTAKCGNTLYTFLYSLVVIPIGLIVNPEMLSTLKFYCRNVIYRPSGWNSTWLLKVALWAICIISINRQLRWATTGEYGKKINKKISPWNFLSWLPILRWERNVLHVFCI